MDSKANPKTKGLNTVNHVAGVFLGTLLILSGVLSVSSRVQKILDERRGAENDLRTRDLNHLVDAIPQCVASCIFPQILDEGCSHTDYRCICSNLRALDNPKLVDPDAYVLNYDDSYVVDGVDSYALEEDVAILAYQKRDTRFSGCFDACTHQDQLGSTHRILDLCNAFKVTVDFPEVMVPIAKRAVDASSMFWSEIPTTDSTDFTSPATTSTPTTTDFPQETAPDDSRTSPYTPEETSPSNNNDPTGIPRESSPSTRDGSPTSIPQETSPSNKGNPTDNNSTGGLSSGAKIGIGVAIPLVVILLILGAFFFFRHRRRRVKPTAETGETPEKTAGGIPELMTTAVDIKKPDQVQYNPPQQGRLPVDAGGIPINELHYDTARQMPEGWNTFELHGQAAPTPRYDSSAPRYEVSASPAYSNSPIARKSIPATSVPTTTSTPSTFPPPWSGGDGAESWANNPVPQPTPPPQELITPVERPSELSAPQAATSPEVSEDADLIALELEMEQVRQKKERLQHLQELEAREAELSKRIAEKKNASNSGGGGAGAGGGG